MALALTVGGTDFLSFVDVKSIGVQQSREVKGSTFNFNMTIYDDTVTAPLAGREVILTDGAVREFAGTLVSVDRQMREANRAILYRCECMDYTYYLDRRYINKLYASQRADLMVGEILDDLQLAANSADAHYNDFQGDKTQISQGSIVAQQRFERILPSQSFDIIAESSGMMWWIDFNKRVNLRNLNALQPSFLPDIEPTGEQSDKVLLVDSDITNFSELSREETIQGTGTKSIIQGARIRSTAQQTDTHDRLAGDPPIVPLSLRPFSVGDVISVKINAGASLTQLIEHVAIEATDAVPSGSYALFLGSPDKSAYVRLNGTDYATGASAEVIYNYSTTDDAEGTDPTAVVEIADRTGGDGIHEFLFSQASEISVVTRTDLDRITEMILARKAIVLVRGSFSSWTKGWEAGQTFILRWDKEGIEEKVYVVNVQKTVLTPANAPSDNVIRSVIQFSNIPRGMRI